MVTGRAAKHITRELDDLARHAKGAPAADTSGAGRREPHQASVELHRLGCSLKPSPDPASQGRLELGHS